MSALSVVGKSVFAAAFPELYSTGASLSRRLGVRSARLEGAMAERGGSEAIGGMVEVMNQTLAEQNQLITTLAEIHEAENATLRSILHSLSGGSGMNIQDLIDDAIGAGSGLGALNKGRKRLMNRRGRNKPAPEEEDDKPKEEGPEDPEEKARAKGVEEAPKTTGTDDELEPKTISDIIADVEGILSEPRSWINVAAGVAGKVGGPEVAIGLTVAGVAIDILKGLGETISKLPVSNELTPGDLERSRRAQAEMHQGADMEARRGAALSKLPPPPARLDDSLEVTPPAFGPSPDQGPALFHKSSYEGEGAMIPVVQVVADLITFKVRELVFSARNVAKGGESGLVSGASYEAARAEQAESILGAAARAPVFPSLVPYNIRSRSRSYRGDQGGGLRASSGGASRSRNPITAPDNIPNVSADQNAAIKRGAEAIAEEDMEKLVGMRADDPASAEKLQQYMRENGIKIDPTTQAWCAAFVNANLAKEGIAGPRGNKLWAPDFKDWGQGIQPTDARKGDVMLFDNLHHVGMFTGKTRRGPNGELQYEMIAGNDKMPNEPAPRAGRDQWGGVGKNWMSASQIMFRRSTQREVDQVSEADVLHDRAAALGGHQPVEKPELLHDRPAVKAGHQPEEAAAAGKGDSKYGPLKNEQNAINFANRMLDLNLRKPEDHAKMLSWMKEAGLDTDPATIGWCREFAAASLRHAGWDAPDAAEEKYASDWRSKKYFEKTEEIHAGEVAQRKDGTHVEIASGQTYTAPSDYPDAGKPCSGKTPLRHDTSEQYFRAASGNLIYEGEPADNPNQKEESTKEWGASGRTDDRASEYDFYKPIRPYDPARRMVEEDYTAALRRSNLRSVGLNPDGSSIDPATVLHDRPAVMPPKPPSANSVSTRSKTAAPAAEVLHDRPPVTSQGSSATKRESGQHHVPGTDLMWQLHGDAA